jgi:hypothetical protein
VRLSERRKKTSAPIPVRSSSQTHPPQADQAAARVRAELGAVLAHEAGPELQERDLVVDVHGRARDEEMTSFFFFGRSSSEARTQNSPAKLFRERKKKEERGPHNTACENHGGHGLWRPVPQVLPGRRVHAEQRQVVGAARDSRWVFCVGRAAGRGRERCECERTGRARRREQAPTPIFRCMVVTSTTAPPNLEGARTSGGVGGWCTGRVDPARGAAARRPSQPPPSPPPSFRPLDLQPKSASCTPAWRRAGPSTPSSPKNRRARWRNGTGERVFVFLLTCLCGERGGERNARARPFHPPPPEHGFRRRPFGGVPPTPDDSLCGANADSGVEEARMGRPHALQRPSPLPTHTAPTTCRSLSSTACPSFSRSGTGPGSPRSACCTSTRT